MVGESASGIDGRLGPSTAFPSTWITWAASQPCGLAHGRLPGLSARQPVSAEVYPVEATRPTVDGLPCCVDCPVRCVMGGGDRSRVVDDAALFDGPGEKRARCRSSDRAATPLGPKRSWPQELRLMCGSVDSGFAMSLHRGPGLAVLYNDAFVPLMGSQEHPQGLGRPTRDVVAEHWDEVIGPLIQRVVQFGSPVVRGRPAVHPGPQRSPGGVLLHPFLHLGYLRGDGLVAAHSSCRVTRTQRTGQSRTAVEVRVCLDNRRGAP